MVTYFPGAHLLWAINESHSLLQNYYITLPAVLPPASLPFLHRFEISGEAVNIKYTRRIKSGTNSFVFEVEVVDGESPWFSFRFIAKFSRQYSAEAHQLHSEDSRSYRLAPTLHSLKELAGGWKALFIEKIDGCLTIHQAQTLPQQDRRAIIEDVSQSLEKLHSHGLVHGDLRFPNVLIVTRPTTRAYLIDFDWSGVEGEATYPHDINLGELHWVDVEDLPKKHDLAALLNFSKRIRAPLE